MKQKDIEQAVRHSFEQLPHDGLSEDVLDACRPTETATQKPRRPIAWISAMAAVAAVVVLICATLPMWRQVGSADLTVSLDVNPSIAIEVGEDETIASVTALNDDAAVILGDTDYAGQPVASTVNTLVAAMVEHGYLSDVANSVLISVDSTDADKAASLQTKLTAEVETMLANDGFDGAVMSQTLHTDKELAALASEYGISTGKAMLICRIRELDPLKTFEELAAVSINDLNLLVEQLQAADIHASGHASDKAYIGEDAAWEMALAHAGLTTDEITKKEAELDHENGGMCYELEFVYNGTEYDYDIDAVTGEILKNKQELEDDGDTQDYGVFKNNADALLDAAQVKETVFAHAGVSEDQITRYDVEWDVRKGVPVYEIDFKVGTTEYEYKIHAETGEILKSETETDDEDDKDDHEDWDDEDTPVDLTGAVDEATVKQTVLTHAAVSEADVTEYRCKAKVKNGTTVYDVEFECGTTEYEYKVDAFSGEILDSEQDIDD